MKAWILGIGALLACSYATAQQKTVGEIISENYERGRQMRQGLEERKAAREKAEQDAQSRREKEEHDATLREVALARNNTGLIMRSKNGLPDIRISTVPVRLCTPPALAAFTTDKDGKPVFGCADLGETHFNVFWGSYGTRKYTPSEWERVSPGGADTTPLGQ